MNILAFDTSGNFLSVGIKTDTSFLEINRLAGLKHSEYLLPSIDHLMKEAGLDFKSLDLIVSSKGPGSFTGLRIGMSTAKGIGAGNNTPIVSVVSLDVYASGLDFFDGAVVPVIDAKKHRYYSSIYHKGKRQSDYLDISPADLISRLNGYERVLFTGPDCKKIISEIDGIEKKPSFKIKHYQPIQGQSSKMIEIGRSIFEQDGADPENAGPLYIRLSDAEISHLEKKS